MNPSPLKAIMTPKLTHQLRSCWLFDVANKMIPTLNSISFISNSITLRERTLMMGLGFQLKMWVGKINKKKAERIEGRELE